MNMRPLVARSSWILLLIALLSLIGVGLVALLHRSGQLHFRPALDVIGYAATLSLWLSVLSGFFAALALLRREHRAAVAGMVALAVGFSLWWPHRSFRARAKTVPPIHDITTDLNSPPAFVKARELRTEGMNSLEYEGEAVAAQQREAYPDLRPILVPMPPAQAHERAVAVARSLGWEVVDSAPSEGRIEAVDTTAFLGFKDDVVIRVAAGEGGSRVDVRSNSRVGRSDVGANAARIERFIRAFSK